MNESPMQPSNFLARIGRRLDYLERLIRQVASAPIRNASIDGPVIISHRGAVTAPSATGGTVSVSPDGVVSTSEDGAGTRIVDGAAEVRPTPDDPWVPITAQSEADAQAALDAAAQAVLDAAGAQASAGQAIIDAAAATAAAATATGVASDAQAVADQAALDAATAAGTASAAQVAADAAQAAADAAAADATGASGDAAAAQAAADAAQAEADAAQSTADSAAATAAAASSAAATADEKAVAAQSAAASAQSTADGALLAANAAQASANGLATITYSTAEPTGSAPVNSTWWRFSGGTIIGQWKRTTIGWSPQTIDDAVIANLNAGKLTAGILNVALVTVQTAATGSRVVFNGSGLIGYDAEGNVKTVIDTATGKITAVDGDFTGTITGSAISGGAISIAEGVTLTIDEAFEAATGTTPPTGWTRQVVNTYGSGGITFLTSGGNPGRRAQLAMVAVPAGQASRQLLYPTTLECVDSYVAFDYRWDGSDLTEFIDFSGITLRLRSKSADAGSDFPDDPYLQMVDGEPTFNSGGDSFPPVLGYGTSAKLAKNVWHRIEVTLRGQAVEVKITPQGGTAYPIWRATLTRVATTGRIAFAVTSSSFLSTNPGGAPQTGWIDNVHIEALKTGFIVAPDGATTVERFAINQVGMAPDPMGPTDIVNLRSMLAVLPVTRVVTSGAVGNTNASGYVTVPVSPALNHVPRAVNVLPNNSQLIGSCDHLNSTTTSLRIYFRTITSAGAPVLASANPGQFSWTSNP